MNDDLISSEVTQVLKSHGRALTTSLLLPWEITEHSFNLKEPIYIEIIYSLEILDACIIKR